MSPVSSTLPQTAHTAAQNALAAALSDPSSKLPDRSTPTTEGNDMNAREGDEADAQEVEAPSGLQTLPMNESPRTVFEDPMAFNVKHPLYTPWTLWFDSPHTKGKTAGMPSTPLTATAGVPPTPMSAQAQNWMEDIKKVINFDSVEEFWGLYNNIVPPSQLPQKANYYLFKVWVKRILEDAELTISLSQENIIPAWEDEANKYGGKWSIQLPRDKNRASIDKMWLYTMLAAIGETFDPFFSQSAVADGSKSETTSQTAPPYSLITGVIVSTRPQFYRLSIWTRLAPGASGSGSPTTPHANAGLNGHGKALTSNGFSPPLPPHPSEEGEGLRERIEAIGKHFKTAVLGYPEGAKLGGPLATEVEFVSHKDSEKKSVKGKKWVV
ncbi:eukaryotic translation initiation factor 4E [Tulasnella sp. 403]|nr:eukaryotic translation initiation factor 4E [Tulasnella sp. 403]